MSIKEIMEKLCAIEEGLDCGYIHYTYTKLYAAMGIGNPVEIFDAIIQDVFWTVQAGREPAQDNMIRMYENLKAFMYTFKIAELWDTMVALRDLLGIEEPLEESDEDEEDFDEDDSDEYDVDIWI